MEGIRAVTMPKWGMTMTEGKVAAWLKAEGDPVAAGDELVEIETDKIANVVEAGAGGLLRRIVTGPGQTAPCGALIAVLAGPDVPEAEIDAFVAARATAAVAAEAGPGLVQRQVMAGGLTLSATLAEGPAEAAPLVLLHGFGSDAGAWMFVQQPLAEGRSVIALDLPSHGASAVDAGRMGLADMAETLAGALDALAPGPLHLGGHSLGGRLALALAGRLGERVRSLTLVAPAGKGAAPDPAFVEGFANADRRRPMKAALQMLVADPGAVGSEMVERALSYKRIDGVPGALAALASSLTPEALAEGWDADLAAVTAPILVLWGEADAVLPPSGAAVYEGRAQVHRIAGAGHLPQMEQAAEVARLIAAHLEAAP